MARLRVGAVERLLVQVLAVEDNVGLDDAAAFLAMGDRALAGRLHHLREGILCAAREAVVGGGGAVELDDVPRAGQRMEPVDVLREDRPHEPLPLHAREYIMYNIGLAPALGLHEYPHAVEILRMDAKDVDAEDLLHAHAMPVLGIEAVGAAEIRNSGEGRDACAGEGNGVLRPLQEGRQFVEFLLHAAEYKPDSAFCLNPPQTGYIIRSFHPTQTKPEKSPCSKSPSRATAPS